MHHNKDINDKHHHNHHHHHKKGHVQPRKLNFSSKKSSSLSSDTRDKILQIKKISNPFDPEIKRVSY